MLVAGLHAPVTLTRDSAGIVHIAARDEHDLFFAQGYNAARDRLFQLELWRRQATGTMAEALGPSWVARDRASRLLKYRGSMTTELAHYHPRGAAIITAFVDGVNAYVDRAARDSTLLPPELVWLGITPGRWTPEVVISRHNALASNAKDEPDLARAVRTMGATRVRAVRRFEPGVARLPLDSLVASVVGAVEDSVLLGAYDAYKSAPTFASRDVAVGIRRAPTPRDTQDAGAREPDRWESNNWVVSGAKSASGKPILANDPHRTIAVPSLRYLVHLTAPGWNVVGGGEPAIPGVAIGHNEAAAWGLTIFGIDAEDLYVYRLSSDNRRYRYGTGEVPMQTITDTIRVRGGDAVPVTLQYTRHGPVLYVDSVTHRAVALRAAWLEAGGAPYLASLRLDQARTWSEARAALAFARMPALNWVWADTSGAIGWQSAGIAPVRNGWDGLTPVPGDGRYEWGGYLPIAELPHEHSPARGFIATANALNVSPAYRRRDAIAKSWAEPFRYDRLRSVLDTAQRLDVAAMTRLQHDEYAVAAATFVPLLRDIELTSPNARAARDTLLAWDYQLRADSRAAAIYALWERRLLAHVFDMVVPLEMRPVLRSVPLSFAMRWLAHPDSLLGDNPTIARDFLFLRSFNETMSDLNRIFGSVPAPRTNVSGADTGSAPSSRSAPNVAAWRYGDPKLHHVRIAHPLDGVVTDSLRNVLSPGPLPRGGYANTVNATGNANNQTAGASLRVVMDLADWDKAVATNTPGQSGDPRSKHYRDLFPLWAAGTYVPLPFSNGAIAKRAESIEIIRP